MGGLNSGNPWDKLMAWCFAAKPDITENIDAPYPGNFDVNSMPILGNCTFTNIKQGVPYAINRLSPFSSACGI
jgi:hypothetical protein